MRKAFLSLFFGGLLGKALGFIRELFLAKFFGTSLIIDSYRAAFVGIFIPMNFFTTDALNAGFIPLYRRYHAQDSEHRHLLFWSLSFSLGILSICFTIAAYFAADLWTAILVPGFSPEARKLTSAFLRVMALGVPFFLQSSISSYLEMGNGIYWQYSLRGSAQSVALIAGTFAAYYFKQPMYLAWSFTICYAVLCVVGWTYMGYKDLLLWPKQWRWIDLLHVQRELWIGLLPLLPLPLFLQGNIALERVVSSLLGTGVVASFEYARIITDTGVLLVAVPLGMAGLSHLSGMDPATVRSRIANMLPVLFISLVAVSTILFANSVTIVHLLFQRGAFQGRSVHLTSQILAGLAAGFWAQVISYVLIKALNAQLRNRSVLIYSVAGLILNSSCNVLAFRFLGPACLGIASSLNYILLLVLTLRAFTLWHVIWKDLLRLFAAAAGYLYLAHIIHSSAVTSPTGELLAGPIYWAAVILIIKDYRGIAKGLLITASARLIPGNRMKLDPPAPEATQEAETPDQLP